MTASKLHAAPSRSHVLVERLFGPDGENVRTLANNLFHGPGNSISDFLGLLLALGVDRARYYEFVNESDHDGLPELLLVAAVPESAHQVRLGLRIPLKDSGLKTEFLATREVASGKVDRTDPRPHLEQLGLYGRTWFRVSVISSDRIVGVLAGDWTAARGGLTDADEIMLRSMSFALAESAQPRGVTYDAPEASSLATLANRLVPPPYINLGETLQSFQASAIAIFSHDWSKARLTKVASRVHADYAERAQRQGTLNEDYPITSDYYGVKAWLHGDVYPVHRFGEISDRGKADEPVRGWYEAVFDSSINCLLYGTVGLGTAPYLIRLMNRHDAPHLTFQRHIDQFRTFLSAVSARIDRDSLSQQLSALSRFATLLEMAPFDLGALELPLSSALGSLGIRVYALTRPVINGTQTTLLPYPRNSSLDVYLDGIDQHVDQFAAFETRDSDCIQQLVMRKTRGASVICIRTRTTLAGNVTDLIVPLNIRGKSISPIEFSDLRQSFQKREALLLDSLRAIAVVASGFAVGARYISVGQEFGLTLAQYLSHEVGARATDVCLLASRTLKQLVERPDDASRFWRADEAIVTIAGLREDLARTIDSAALVDIGEVDLQMAAHTLSSVVEQAVRLCKARFPIEYRRRYDISDYSISTAVDDGTIVCDKARIVQSLTALLDNAIKYSQPDDSHPPPCDIRVHSRLNDASITFRVENRGFALPEGTRLEELLRPFSRGLVKNPVRRIPGLGLGLHIASTNVRAHGGSLRLRSTPTLRDANIRHREGHLVVAEVSIPRGIQPGSYAWSEKTGTVREPVPGRYPTRAGDK